MADHLDQTIAPRKLTLVEGMPATVRQPRTRWVFRTVSPTHHHGPFTYFEAERVRVPVDRAVASWSYQCANCDTRFRAGTPTPYCSLACKSQAKTVRAFRAAFVSYGRDSLPVDVEQALRIKLAQALAGGYDSAARYLPRAAREAIIERDGGLCRLCHSPGTEIDHIDGDSSDPGNLRLLCHACHIGVTMSHFRHIDPRTEPEIDAAFDQLTDRIDSTEPTRACDGRDWHSTWRSWVREHAEPLSEQVSGRSQDL